jgi:membrane fusion protein (multidrug efflux system)
MRTLLSRIPTATPRPRSLSRPAPILAVSWLVLVASCGPDDSQNGPRGGNRAAPVRVAPVESLTFRETVSGIGTVRAKETVEIRAEAAGPVKEVHFREGEHVDRGALLFTLDDELLRRRLAERRAALAAARAKVELARKTFRRMETLWKEGSVAKDRYDEAKTAYESNRSEVDRLAAAVDVIRERLEDTTIRAPLAGDVSERLVAPGDVVAVGTRLVTLHHVQAIEVDVAIPGVHRGRVQTGQRAELAVDAHPDRRFEGHVSFVSPQVDEQTRSFLVKVAVENPDGLLAPGAFAKVTILVGKRTGRPAVPEEGLVATRQGYVVFVVKDGAARKRPVEVGLRRTGRAEITGGLDVGETVVRAGHMELSDGDRVRIQDGTTEPGAAAGTTQPAETTATTPPARGGGEP